MSDPTRRQILRGGLTLGALIAAGGAARAQGRAHTVRIEGFAFRPARLEIAAGDTVTFVNADGAPHTATADNRSFDTGRLRRGQSAGLRFDSPGEYSYFCAVHPRMKGSVIVR